MEAEEDIDEDDGVIFEGSPLYQSLTDAGYSAEDLETELMIRTSANKTETLTDSKNSETQKTSDHKQLIRYDGKIKIYVRALMEFFWLSIMRQIQDLERKYNNDNAWCLCNSESLEEDDSEFLRNYMQYSPKTDIFTTPKNGLHFTLLFLLIIPCTVAYGYTRITEPQFPWQYSFPTDIITVLSVIYLFSKFIVFISVRIYQNRLEMKQKILEKLIVRQESLLSYLKKSIRLIQETDLVARGFTLISQKNQVSYVEKHAGQYVSRQCPDLRKLLFYTARDAVLDFREFTKALVKLCPLGPDLDNHSSYLAFQPIEQYGPCLQVTGRGEEADKELYHLTEGFSIAAIKGVCHLLRLQQSEFTTRLTLVFYSQSQQEQDSFTLKSVSGLEPFLTEVIHQLSHCVSTLQRSYDIHNSSILEKDTHSRKPTPDLSPYTDLHVAIHSLDLHLQAALTRVRSLDSLTENKMAKEQADKADIPSYDKLNDLLKSVGAELQSCKGCWEEGVSRLDKLQKRDVKRDEAPEKAEPEVPRSLAEPLQQIQDQNPVIVDQVFEGYNDQDFEVEDYSWEKPLTAEEKEKKKREKEEALRLLVELKSVISVRAVEREKRELEALQRSHSNQQVISARPNQIAGTQSHDTVNSIPSECSMAAPSSAGIAESCTATDLSQVDRNVKLTVPADTLEVKSKCDEQSNGIHLNTDKIENSLSKMDESECDIQSADTMERDREEKLEESEGGFRFRLPPVNMEERLGRLPGANLSFSLNVAAQAAAKSQSFWGHEETTFGDDEEEEVEVEDVVKLKEIDQSNI